MGEMIYIIVRCRITLRPSLFPIGSLDELLIPVGPVFQLKCKTLAWSKSGCGYYETILESDAVVL